MAETFELFYRASVIALYQIHLSGKRGWDSSGKRSVARRPGNKRQVLSWFGRRAGREKREITVEHTVGAPVDPDAGSVVEHGGTVFEHGESRIIV